MGVGDHKQKLKRLNLALKKEAHKRISLRSLRKSAFRAKLRSKKAPHG